MESKELPTAEEFIYKFVEKKQCDHSNELGNHEIEEMVHEYAVLFAKWHRKEMIEAIEQKGEAYLVHEDFYDFSKGVKGAKIDMDSIENAYKEDNIK